MLKKAKEVIVSADSQTKGILVVACIYFVVMLTAVSSRVVNQIMNLIPTVDTKLQDGIDDEKDYLVKQDTVMNILEELSVGLGKNDSLNKDKDYIV